MTMTHYQELNPNNAAQQEAIANLWNDACGANLNISVRFAEFNLRSNTGGSVTGRFAMQDGVPVGVVIASLLRDEPSVMSPETGWINALVVAPSAQGQGIGRELLRWAEDWLRTQGCQGVVLGSDLRPFTPGVPSELNTVDFFARQGYEKSRIVCDMAANLAQYQTPTGMGEIDGAVRPAQRGDEAALLEFLRREFPGRWRYSAEEFLRDPHHRISDYMLLWTERGVDGFCLISFEDSLQPIERFYPYGLPRPWGQLGSVGVSADRRGRGYGAAVVDAGLRRLHNNGINGCVIDWLVIVDFYAKFGFTVYREYQQMTKQLA